MSLSTSPADTAKQGGISRRTLLIGGGVGAGLLIAFGIWPRSYRPNLRVAPGENLFNAFLKIADDGRIIVAVPQAEIGQGVWTSLPQILADELGADWRTVSVEPAPISPLYANLVLADESASERLPSALHGIGSWTAREYATRNAGMLTAGSTSIRAFEGPMREAGAAARALLSKAAAKRWNMDWESLDTARGFVINGNERISFADLVADASNQELPEYLPMRGGVENRLVGEPLPRLDLPSKVDGTALFAGDIRMADMVYVSSRSGPIPGSRLVEVDRKAANAIPGVIGILENPGWAAAVASNWWAANRALEAMKPVFEMKVSPPSSASIETALAGALEEGGSRIFSRGDIEAAYAEGQILRARYAVGAAANAPMESLTATARLQGDRLEIYAPTQAPGLARAAAARAAGLPETQVTIHTTLIGGGYGRKIEMQAIEQAAQMAMHIKRPVQLIWSRVEESVQDTFRAPALAVLSARLGQGGFILGWQARIAAPVTANELSRRLAEGSHALSSKAGAVAGAIPPYAIPAVAIDHHPAEIGIRTGMWRSGAHSYTAFFTESFVDELARQARIEPLSFRMQMLGDNPRLARCLSTAAALGGWDGGGEGSMMGIAAHSCLGSHVAILVEVEVSKLQRVKVRRAVAAVDCGRVINPDIVRQQIEGGIIFGIAAATGNAIDFEDGRPNVRGFGSLGFPTLADSPEVVVEIIRSQEPPGGVTELGVPAVAPAIANALYAITGARFRSLPFVVGGGT